MGHTTNRRTKQKASNHTPATFLAHQLSSRDCFPCAFTTLLFLPACAWQMLGVVASWVGTAFMGHQFDLHLLERWWYFSRVCSQQWCGRRPRGLSSCYWSAHSILHVPRLSMPALFAHLLANSVIRAYTPLPCSSNLLLAWLLSRRAQEVGETEENSTRYRTNKRNNKDLSQFWSTNSSTSAFKF